MTKKKQKYTVLLLSAPIGSGHRLAAEALREAFAEHEEVEVVHGNVFDFFPHFLGTAFLRSYLWILGCCPWLYELAYKWGNSQGGSLWLRSMINRTLACLGSSYLKSINPDVVIATHATPAGIMSYYKHKHPELFLGAVITDFTVHKWWLCEGVETYFLADARLKDKITVPTQVEAFGIPLRQQFKNNAYDACRQKYGWRSDERVCLIMGGGEGLLPMEEMIAALEKEHLAGLRLVAITGHNEKLAQKLRQRFASENNSGSAKATDTACPIEIYGFRQDVPQLLAAADMIVTKAGGLTCAEVLASGLDLLIYKPLPGQEQGNAAFLEKNYHAQICVNLEHLVQAIAKLACDSKPAPGKKPLGNALAAEQIVDYVLRKIRSK